MSREMKILFGKEWKQAVRNRAALLSATILPVLFLLVVPMAQAFATSRGLMDSGFNRSSMPPGLVDATPETMFSEFTFPLFVILGGLMIPSLAASYTIVSEREKRTVDLLLALPLSLGQIVAAKIGAVLALAVAITFPLLLVDFAILLGLGIIQPVMLIAYTLELVAALAFSASSAVAVALLARDYRAANNLNGAFMGPVILGVLAAIMLVPGGLFRLVALALVLLLLGAVILVAALRLVSLERFAL